MTDPAVRFFFLGEFLVHILTQREPTPPANNSDGPGGCKPKKKITEVPSVIMVSSDVEDKVAQAVHEVLSFHILRFFKNV